MAARFAAIVPRMAVIGLVWLLATATLTYAAGELTTPAKVATTPAATPRPDSHRPATSATRRSSSRRGFSRTAASAGESRAPCTATRQTLSRPSSPRPGTQVVDTGAPTLKLTLRRGTYPQDGTAQNASPYAGTSILLPKRSSAAAQSLSLPSRRRRSRRRRARSEPRSLLSSAPAGPSRSRSGRPPSPSSRPRGHARRPSSFTAPRKKPLDEIPLTTRAQRLSAWLTRPPPRPLRTSATGYTSTPGSSPARGLAGRTELLPCVS